MGGRQAGGKEEKVSTGCCEISNRKHNDLGVETDGQRWKKSREADK